MAARPLTKHSQGVLLSLKSKIDSEDFNNDKIFIQKARSKSHLECWIFLTYSSPDLGEQSSLLEGSFGHLFELVYRRHII